MDEQLRELTKEVYEKAADNCTNCTHKCYIYVFTTYINENSYDYFLYQLEHGSLPEAVRIAYSTLMQRLGNPDGFTIVANYCNLR